MSDEPKEPKKPLYSRKNLTPETPLVREPEKPPAPELTPEQIDRRLAVLDKIGTRIIRLDSGLAITTPIEPTEKMMQALADLKMDLPIVLLKTSGALELYYPVLPKGWLQVWETKGWKGVEGLVRNAITQMA